MNSRKLIKGYRDRADHLNKIVDEDTDYQGEVVLVHYPELVEELINTLQNNNATFACTNLTQQILNNFPESVDKLCDLLLDFKYKLEEGIGQKP